MSEISRRAFLRTAAGSAAMAGFMSAGALELRANPLGLPIGCQTWPVRKLIARDFPGTIKKLKAAGFQSIELCSPVGYADLGFGGLAKYSGAELRRMIRDLGVECISSHFSLQELRQNQEGRIAWAKELGLTQMMVPSLDGPQHPTLDDVKRAAGEFNRIAERAARAGIQQGLHNEGFLDTSLDDGQKTYDILFKLLNPRTVKFQFQISAIEYGFDPIHYFTTYPGRFISMHVQGWDARTRKIVAVGQGTLNWKKIFAAAKIGGIRNYYVEMDFPLMKASVPYLRHLRVRG
jgi:sugar phosphate isomerase/epimerase